MPTATYIALANTTLSSNVSTVTFGSIPNTYRDLVLVINGRTPDGTNGAVRMRFNSDTTDANYSRVFMLGSGSGTQSAATNGHFFFDLYEGDPQTTIFHIMDYSATDKHKTILGRWQGQLSYVVASANRWANTNAITTIQIAPNSFNLQSGTTLSLYGIVS